MDMPFHHLEWIQGTLFRGVNLQKRSCKVPNHLLTNQFRDHIRNNQGSLRRVQYSLSLVYISCYRDPSHSQKLFEFVFRIESPEIQIQRIVTFAAEGSTNSSKKKDHHGRGTFNHHQESVLSTRPEKTSQDHQKNQNQECCDCYRPREHNKTGVV